jgi:hypothetical protein
MDCQLDTKLENFTSEEIPFERSSFPASYWEATTLDWILDDDDDDDHGFHPMVVDYLCRLGDMDILQENYEELVDEQTAIPEEQEARARYGLSLDAEDQNFFGRLPCVETKSTQESSRN